MVAGKEGPGRSLAPFGPHAYDPQLRAFPHAGVPSTILVDQRDPETGRHVVTHVRRLFDLLSTSPLTFYPYVSQQVSRSYELESCAETFCEVADFDDASLIRDFVDTLYEIDAFGNPKIRTTALDTGSDLITYRYETDYLNDAQTWLLGLPIHQREFFIELGGDIRERDVTTVYDPATGAPTSQIREPTPRMVSTRTF